MAQFGVGPEFAAQCPRLPTPNGWRPWNDSDGPIPDGLVNRSKALVDDTLVSLGATESYPIPGVTALILIEPRQWGRDASGNLVQGCFRSGGIYLPSGTPPAETITPPEESRTNKIIAGLTVVSLAVGIGATLYGFGGR